ncbi:MAG: thiolase family protein [Rhizobiaceae bacterium]|nr:thiolase family protein [Rhizobiaceae bacterium]
MSHHDPVCIVGIGETPPVRRSDKNLRQLVIDASIEAIADAGLSPSDIDGIVTDSVIMPNSVPHEYVAAQLGIDRTFDAALSYGGAGIVCAPMLAEMAIRAGRAKNVLCYFGVDWGSIPAGPYGFHDLYPAKTAYEKPFGFSGQPSYFALWARRYMHEYGLKEEDLAMIAVNQRKNALLTGRSQARSELTLEDYMNSRVISDPLRVPDCCLISDGAGAFVMTSAERAKDLRKPPVNVLGVGFAMETMTGDDIFTQKPDLMHIPGAAEAGRQACERSGISLDDVDFAEIYDCFTISCLMQIEDIGFCKKGEAADFLRSKGTTVDGGFPVNTHGGLLSYSYRLGVEHVVEAVRQLRGEAGANQVKNARIGLVGGLSMPDYGVAILGR